MESMFRLSNGQATAKRLKTDSEDYKVCANECIRLHLFDPSTSSSSWPPSGLTGSFKPEFTHQIFGDDEEIVGFKGLAVDIYFSQADFQAFVEIAFEDKAYGATDILSTLQEHFPGGLTSDKQQFLTVATTKQAGTPLQKLGSPLSIPEVRKGLSVTQANLAGGSQELKDLHERLQPFLLFFIDGASFLDADDPKWELLLATEHQAGRDVVVGFCTLYTFYAYPDTRRFRLSQILVLPPFQHKGIGAALLRAAYVMADKCNAVDVTFEDPTDTLQSLRDLIDLQRAMGCVWLQSAAEQVAAVWQTADPAAVVGTSGSLRTDSGTNKALADAQKQLRISQQQARRIWEAVLYAQPKVRTDAGLATLAQLVRRRIEGNSASVKKQAETKRVFDVAHQGFIMRKCKGKMPLLPGNGVPVAMENDEQTPEEAEQALTEALTARITSLDGQLAKLGILKR
ncbi:TPA: putative uncategorized biosynthetic cluster [Trebouxia sp. C0005]